MNGSFPSGMSLEILNGHVPKRFSNEMPEPPWVLEIVVFTYMINVPWTSGTKPVE